MTPGVFINERSFVGQGKTPHDAACLMNELVSTIKRLNTHLGQSAVFYKAAQFMQLPLTKDLSMQGWIERGEAKNCDARNFLLRYLNRQPYFEGRNKDILSIGVNTTNFNLTTRVLFMVIG